MFSRSGGRTVLSDRSYRWPYEIGQLTHHRGADPARLIVQSGTGTINAGDRLRQRFTLQESAHVRVRGQGAVSVHTARSGTGSSEEIELVLASGSRLELLQEPRILFPGAAFRQRTTAEVPEDSQLILVDAMVRHPEPGQVSYLSELHIERGGRALVTERMGFGGHAAESIPASALVIAAGIEHHPESWSGWLQRQQHPERYGAASALPNCAGTGVKIVAADGRLLREALADALSILETDS